MPSSSLKLVVRLFLTKRFDLTTQAIMDEGSGFTLIIRQLLLEDTQLQPVGELASIFHDVNGGLAPHCWFSVSRCGPWGPDLIHLL